MISHPNRPNKRRNKKGSSCALCKPWKHGWGNARKDKERDRMKKGLEELKRS